jgi:plasmid stabilization system protein ParE
VNYEFLPEARDELWEAALHYASQEEGLGARFRSEVARVVERIVADPYLWQERGGGYRRVNCPVFPYYVAYFIRADKVLIAAVAHGHRRPSYWKDRMTGA